MLNNNFLVSTLKIGARSLMDFLYFPLWWYGPGLVGFIKDLGLFLRDRESMLGLGVWIKNIFVPMYGQSDIGGRIISFIMRLIQIVLRSLALFLWLLAALAALFIWLLLPPAIIFALSAQFSSLGSFIN